METGVENYQCCETVTMACPLRGHEQCSLYRYCQVGDLVGQIVSVVVHRVRKKPDNDAADERIYVKAETGSSGPKRRRTVTWKRAQP